MITIFRRIRKSLLQSSNLRRYLLYAIGEVILVVIGILLALQINTWNNDKNLRIREKVYLKEISENLKDDLNTIEHVISFHKKKDSIIVGCLDVILRAESNLEVAKYIDRHMPILAEYAGFMQNRIAFDNMLSAENIDIISDSKLKSLLSFYYRNENLGDATQDRARQLTRRFIDYITPLLMNRELNEARFGVKNQFISADQINFKSDIELMGNLFGMKQNHYFHILMVEGIKADVLELREHIDAFLEK